MQYFEGTPPIVAVNKARIGISLRWATGDEPDNTLHAESMATDKIEARK